MSPRPRKVLDPKTVEEVLRDVPEGGILSDTDRMRLLSEMAKTGNVAAMKLLNEIATQKGTTLGPPAPQTPQQAAERLATLMKVVGKEVSMAAFQVAFVIPGVPYQEPEDSDGAIRDDEATPDGNRPPRQRRTRIPAAESVPGKVDPKHPKEQIL